MTTTTPAAQTIDTDEFRNLLDEFAYAAGERRALGGDFGSADAEGTTESNLIAHIDAKLTAASPAVPSDEYEDCPKCKGSRVLGEVRGIRCSMCNGTATVAAQEPAPATQQAACTPTEQQFAEWCERHDLPPHHSREAFDDAASLYLTAPQALAATQQAEPVAIGYIADEAAEMLKLGRGITINVSPKKTGPWSVPVYSIAPVSESQSSAPKASGATVPDAPCSKCDGNGHIYNSRGQYYGKCSCAAPAAPEQTEKP